MQSYQEAYPGSLKNANDFWLEKADAVAWFTPPTQGVNQVSEGQYRWFRDGKLNTSYLCLEHHINNGRGDQVALYYDSPVTQSQKSFTYRELRDEVALFAGVLNRLGVEKGDRVVIYMPMIPEVVVAMLACARIGAIHSVVFGGFAARELAIRIDDARPKVLLTAGGGIEVNRVVPYKPIVDEALEQASFPPETCVVYQRPFVEAPLKAGRDLDWQLLLAEASTVPHVELEATDPLYILYTSGTTGKPKGIVRDNGGHAVALMYSMKYIYGMEPGEVFWAASDVGWVVGHSYIVYAPLLYGCTTILFEGKPVKTPDPGTFWRVIEEYKVKLLFTAPTAIRAIKKEDPNGKFAEAYDTNSLAYLFLAGERTDVATYEWARELLNVEVIDHWWQTESGWPMISNPVGYGRVAVKPGSASLPVCGYDIRFMDEAGKEVPTGQEGALAIKLPLPPGCLPTLWNNDARYKDSYLSTYPGYYLAGDGGYRDEDGYLYITGRIDDVINVAGHRFSTADMEEVVASHPSVAECAVIGIANELKGQVPIGLVVLKEGENRTREEVETELIDLIRHKVGAVASFRCALVAMRLPKTRSGKILRKVMRFIADGTSYNMPSTIEDPATLEEIRVLFKESRIGIGWGE